MMSPGANPAALQSPAGMNNFNLHK